MGLLAERNSKRHNRIGVTIGGSIRIEGRPIEVGALDAIDGTPVVDIKRWVKKYSPGGEFYQPATVTE